MATQIGGLSNNGAIPLKPKTTSGVINLGSAPTSANPITPKPIQQGSLQGMINLPQNTAPKTPVKSTTVTHPSGTIIKTDYHPEAKTGDAKTATTTNPTSTPKASQPSLTVGGQAPGVLSSGNVTDLEQHKLAQLEQAGQMTSQEEAANAEVAKANELQKSYKNVGTLSPYAEASMYSDRARTPEEIQAIQQAPDLAGRASSTNGLTNSLSNIYGSSRVAGANAALQGIQTAAARGLSAAQSGLSGAQTQASRASSAATNVLGAVAPQFPSYGSQVIQPGILGTGTSGVGGGLQEAVSNVVQRLQSGTMSYNDAVSALSGYGQGGLNALQQALPSNFNVAQSNTLAGQQGSIGVNYQLADTALKNVENLIGELNASQRTNIPGVNAVTQGFSTLTGLGSEQTRAVTGAVQSLRNAYASLLASSKGGTPTDYSGQAQAEIPDQPTPNDLKAIRHNFEVLGKSRADILGNPGQAGGTSTQSGGSSVWDF